MEDGKKPPTDGQTDGQKPPTETFAKLVPQEFHDRPYLKDILNMPVSPETYHAVFKKLDGAEKLIGKKTAIPDAASASKEDWDQFFSRLRPETAEAYEFKVADGKKAPDEKVVKAIKEMFFKAGLNKRQAEMLQQDFDAFAEAQTAEQRKAAEDLDKQFEELTAKTFGADNAAILQRTKAMLDQFTPENLKPFVGKLPNESLVILAGVLEGVHQKYVREDGGKGGGAPAGGHSVDALREEARKIMATEKYTDAFHPGHEAAVAKVQQIYASLPKDSGKKK